MTEVKESNNFVPTDIYELLESYRVSGDGFTYKQLSEITGLNVTSIYPLIRQLSLQDSIDEGEDPNTHEWVLFLSEQAFIPQVQQKSKLPVNCPSNPITVIPRDVPKEFKIGGI